MRFSPRSLRTLAPGLAVAALTAAIPAAAGAATITTDGNGIFTYTGASGEINSGSVQGTDDGAVVFYSSGSVPLSSVPAACTTDGSRDATCTGVRRAVWQAGDGDENVAVSSSVPAGVAVTLDGGPGNDWLRGDKGDDTLLGGPGNDRLEGSAGNDTLDGGDDDDDLDGGAGADHVLGGNGDDSLEPDAHEDPSADVVDGGPGIDTITGDYSSRFRSSSAGPQTLNFTLAGGADDGRPGEGDDIRNVERLIVSDGGKFAGTDGDDYIKLAQVGSPGELIGGNGDDDLNGGDGADRLDGGPGNDHLDGGFGDDVIIGGPGRDTISGDRAGGDCGPLWCKYPYGNDTIYAQDGEIDSIVCGWGEDTVYADAVDVVDGDCEHVIRSAAAPAPGTAAPGSGAPAGKPKGAGAHATLAGKATIAKALKSGFALNVTGAKAGNLKLSATRSGRIVAKGSGRVSKNGKATIKLRFTAQSKRALRHAETLKLKISGGGVSTTITLKRR